MNGDGKRKWDVIPSIEWATAKDAESDGIFAKNIYINNYFPVLTCGMVSLF